MDRILDKTNIFSPAVALWESSKDPRYCDLVEAVKNVHHQSYHVAVKAVNRYATMRNWLIGFFIVEYQQKGKDRAEYGERLLKRLEESLSIRGLNVTLFQNSRLFYTCYPQVAELFLIQNQPTALVKSEREGMQDKTKPTPLAELANNLFVSTYLLELPDKSVLEQFIRKNNHIGNSSGSTTVNIQE